jgi:hypothetical protein
LVAESSHSAGTRQHQAISAQGTLRAEGTEDVVRGANEQPAQVPPNPILP